MKTFLIELVVVFFLGSVGLLHAKMTPATFNAGESLTSGKLFLNQVDTVSLYLSTERIVYVPRLTQDLHLSVSLTLLGMSFGSNTTEMEKFVVRHIQAFNKTLKERLEFYAPQLAKEFDPNQDVDFVVKVGADQKSVATWQGGEWKWIDTSKKQASVVEVGSDKKKCPAMIGTKKEEGTPPAIEASATPPPSR
ncbi:MAG: hypothetical protein HY877_03610 [Deltaproteobacteria bacterium]|nr:hypothetical protein [Deltaproteobacteria bacterium]